MNSDHIERNLVKTLGKGRVNALNAQQLVAELEKANVGSETFVLSYATSPSVDLERLRKWIDKRLPQGTKNPLPPISMCIPLINLLRHNIVKNITGKEAKDLTLSLEVVFPTVFPQERELIGLNHQPLVDCLQARLLGLQALRYFTGEGPFGQACLYEAGSLGPNPKRDYQLFYPRKSSKEGGIKMMDRL
jgi:hypothetical protein